jgi:hypothetical protein
MVQPMKGSGEGVRVDRTCDACERAPIGRVAVRRPGRGALDLDLGRDVVGARRAFDDRGWLHGIAGRCPIDESVAEGQSGQLSLLNILVVPVGNCKVHPLGYN